MLSRGCQKLPLALFSTVIRRLDTNLVIDQQAGSTRIIKQQGTATTWWSGTWRVGESKRLIRVAGTVDKGDMYALRVNCLVVITAWKKIFFMDTRDKSWLNQDMTQKNGLSTSTDRDKNYSKKIAVLRQKNVILRPADVNALRCTRECDVRAVSSSLPIYKLRTWTFNISG